METCKKVRLEDTSFMDRIRCKYCQVFVTKSKYGSHRDQHRKESRVENGQNQNQQNGGGGGMKAPESVRLSDVSVPDVIIKKEIPVVDLTLSEDEADGVRIYQYDTCLPFDQPDPSDNTDTYGSEDLDVSEYDLDLLKCEVCQEYFLNQEDCDRHSLKYHPDSPEAESLLSLEVEESDDNSVDKTDESNSIQQTSLVCETNQNDLLPRLSSEEDNIEIDIDEDSSSSLISNVSQLIPESIEHNDSSYSEDRDSPVATSSASVLRSFTSVETSKPSSSRETLNDDASSDESFTPKPAKKRKKYPPTQEYYVQRAAAKKIHQYNDHICPYCHKDCHSASRWESHIRSKHERRAAENDSPEKSPSPEPEPDPPKIEHNAPLKKKDTVVKQSKGRGFSTHLKAQCQYCKIWITKSGMSYHLRIHTGEKPYSCRNCNVHFRGRPSLYRHEKMCMQRLTVTLPNKQKKKISVRAPSVRRRLSPAKPVLSPLSDIPVGPNDDLSDDDGAKKPNSSKKSLKRKSSEMSESSSNKSTRKPLVETPEPKDISTDSENDDVKLYMCEECDFATFSRSELGSHVKTHEKVRKQLDKHINVELSKESNVVVVPRCKLSTATTPTVTKNKYQLLRNDGINQSQVVSSNNEGSTTNEQVVKGSSSASVNSYRCLMCLRVYGGESVMREHIKLYHDRTLQTLIRTDEDPSLGKRILKLTKKVSRISQQAARRRKKLNACNDECASPDEKLPRLVVKMQGESIAGCSVLSPKRSKQPSQEAIDCEFCTDKFLTHDAYLLHVIRHKGAAIRSCTECEKTFLHSQYYRQHMSQVHNVPLPCKSPLTIPSTTTVSEEEVQRKCHGSINENTETQRENTSEASSLRAATHIEPSVVHIATPAAGLSHTVATKIAPELMEATSVNVHEAGRVAKPTEPVKLQSPAQIESVKIPSPTSRGPVKLPSPASKEPVKLLSLASREPVKILSPASREPVKIPSPTTTEPVKIPSPKTTEPVRIPSAASGERVEIHSPTTTAPVEVPSPTTTEPIKIPSPAPTEPVRTPSPAQAEPVKVPSPAPTVSEQVHSPTPSKTASMLTPTAKEQVRIPTEATTGHSPTPVQSAKLSKHLLSESKGMQMLVPNKKLVVQPHASSGTRSNYKIVNQAIIGTKDSSINIERNSETDTYSNSSDSDSLQGITGMLSTCNDSQIILVRSDESSSSSDVVTSAGGPPEEHSALPLRQLVIRPPINRTTHENENILLDDNAQECNNIPVILSPKMCSPRKVPETLSLTLQIPSQDLGKPYSVDADPISPPLSEDSNSVLTYWFDSDSMNVGKSKESSLMGNDITNLEMLSLIATLEPAGSRVERQGREMGSQASCLPPSNIPTPENETITSANLNSPVNGSWDKPSSMPNTSGKKQAQSVIKMTNKGKATGVEETNGVRFIYNVGSKSKMLSRRQCPYCCVNYQSQLALEEHIAKAHSSKKITVAASQG